MIFTKSQCYSIVQDYANIRRKTKVAVFFQSYCIIQNPYFLSVLHNFKFIFVQMRQFYESFLYFLIVTFQNHVASPNAPGQEVSTKKTHNTSFEILCVFSCLRNYLNLQRKSIPRYTNEVITVKKMPKPKISSMDVFHIFIRNIESRSRTNIQ